MYKGILPDPNIRGDVLPSAGYRLHRRRRSKLGLFPRNAEKWKLPQMSESNLSKIHGWLIEHCLNIYVARNCPVCVRTTMMTKITLLGRLLYR